MDWDALFLRLAENRTTDNAYAIGQEILAYWRLKANQPKNGTAEMILDYFRSQASATDRDGFEAVSSLIVVISLLQQPHTDSPHPLRIRKWSKSDGQD